MAFVLRLFRINLLHTYYEENVRDDFALVPSEATQQWMRRYPMRLVASLGCFEVFWRVAGLTHRLQTLQEKMDEEKLSFYLTLKHPSVMGCSSLSMDRGRVYYFHNTGGGARLHQEAYVSEADKIPIQELVSHPSQLIKSFFGIVDIHLKELWQGQSFTEAKLPIDYAIHIKASASMDAMG